MLDKTLQIIAQKLDAERANIVESLGDATAKDFGEYKYACGVVRGLLIAKSLVIDLASNLESIDE
jgi:hypothetical protein